MSLSMGQNPGYINNIETGKSLPSLTGIFYICEYLGVTPSEFFNMEVSGPSKLDAIVNDESTNNKLLYELNEGAYGVFMATEVTQGEMMMENECQFDASEICDAQFEDGFRFGFIKDEKTDTGICCDTIVQRNDKIDNVFTSLESYKWPDIIAYILKSMNE